MGEVHQFFPDVSIEKRNMSIRIIKPMRKIINIKSDNEKLIFAALIYPNTFIGRKDNLNLVFCLVESGYYYHNLGQ
jgi:hypothetical protein